MSKLRFWRVFRKPFDSFLFLSRNKRNVNPTFHSQGPTRTSTRSPESYPSTLVEEDVPNRRKTLVTVEWPSTFFFFFFGSQIWKVITPIRFKNLTSTNSTKFHYNRRLDSRLEKIFIFFSLHLIKIFNISMYNTMYPYLYWKQEDRISVEERVPMRGPGHKR